MARGSVGLGAVLLIVIVAAVFLAPGSPFQAVPEPAGNPEIVLTSLAEGTCADAPGTALDDDCATGVTEIAINFDELVVVVDVTSTASANTLAPDSFAVDFGVRCQAGCTRSEGGALMETSYHARITGMSHWVLLGNTTTVEIVERGAGDDDIGPLIGWTSATELGGQTFWGSEEGGTLARLGDTETATITLTVVLNEDLPQNIPTGAVFNREAQVQIFSPVGGNSLTVTLILTLTSND